MSSLDILSGREVKRCPHSSQSRHAGRTPGAPLYVPISHVVNSHFSSLLTWVELDSPWCHSSESSPFTSDTSNHLLPWSQAATSWSWDQGTRMNIFVSGMLKCILKAQDHLPSLFPHGKKPPGKLAYKGYVPCGLPCQLQTPTSCLRWQWHYESFVQGRSFRRGHFEEQSLQPKIKIDPRQPLVYEPERLSLHD